MTNHATMLDELCHSQSNFSTRRSYTHAKETTFGIKYAPDASSGHVPHCQQDPSKKLKRKKDLNSSERKELLPTCDKSACVNEKKRAMKPQFE